MPWILAASSSDGFMARNICAVRMNASAARLSPCTKPMPTGVAMLMGPCSSPNVLTSQRLRKPMRWCAMKVHPMAV